MPSPDFVVEERKLLHYVLNPDHADGKAQFFALLGFDHSNWEVLQKRLLDLAHLTPPSQWSIVHRNGVRLIRMTALLQGMNHRSRDVLMVWQDHGVYLRLVSVYPAKT